MRVVIVGATGNVPGRPELDWEPRYSATESLEELLAGMRAGGHADTPPLSRQTSGPLRIRELLGRVGGRP
jgi:hypothetical protein